MELFEKLQKQICSDADDFVFGGYYHSLCPEIRPSHFLHLWRTFRFCSSVAHRLAFLFLPEFAKNTVVYLRFDLVFIFLFNTEQYFENAGILRFP